MAKAAQASAIPGGRSGMLGSKRVAARQPHLRPAGLPSSVLIHHQAYRARALQDSFHSLIAHVSCNSQKDPCAAQWRPNECEPRIGKCVGSIVRSPQNNLGFTSASLVLPLQLRHPASAGRTQSTYIPVVVRNLFVFLFAIGMLFSTAYCDHRG